MSIMHFCAVQARNGILAKIGRISELYARMDAAIAVTEGQLHGMEQSIEQHEAARPPPDSPLEQGPSEVRVSTADLEERRHA